MGNPISGNVHSRSLAPTLTWGAASLLLIVVARHTIAENWGAPATQPANGAILSTENTSGANVTMENSARCVSCHRFDQALNHPIQVSPVLSTPSSLPLLNGQVVCITCHDASPDHRSKDQPVGQRVEGTALCVSCHKGSPNTSRAIHSMSGSKAHLRTDSRSRVGHGAAELDRESQSCMECHDGALSSDAGPHISGLDSKEKSEHPIGVSMRPTTRNRDSDFRLSRRVDDRIRLFEGTVGCGSCHSPYSRERKLLVMNNRGSALCLNCHTQ